jgi:tetratricopeptide (TPR) repeat protein
VCKSYSTMDGGRSTATWIWGLTVLAACSGCKLAADGKNLAGVRAYQQGQYDVAMQSFQKAVATDPTNADAYYNMAATMHRVGAAKNDPNALSQAETLYNQCLDRSPDHPDCHRGLAVLLTETGRSDRAFNLLKTWSARSPRHPEAHIELARLYEEFGNLEPAKLELTEALQVDPHNARAWNALARLREQSGDYVQALANYQRSLEVNRFQPEVAERVAALNRSISSGAGPAQPGGSRMVTSTTPTNR